MYRRIVGLFALLGMAGLLGACAASGNGADAWQRPSLYASGTHLEFSLKYRGKNATLPVSPHVLERARAESWWGEPAGIDPKSVVELPVVEEYDPWEPYNESMFTFNRNVDRFALKPAAQAWNAVVPVAVQRGVSRIFTNLATPRRLVNHVLQLRGDAALREVTRFVINSTAGLAGFFDVAATLGLEGREADTGQTLGVYGIGPGPYLLVPVLPPLTVRDGIGLAVDSVLDPLSYLLPLVVTASMTGGRVVNERALRLEEFEELERDLFDPYGAVRNAYLQFRRRAIQEAVLESFAE